jgi:hypothetical protein
MARKKRRSEHENFARIPLSVLQAEAVKTLNHAAFKVLVILASQWRGGNNGTLALTERYAREYGLSGRDTLYRSLKELESRGLIVRTRQGMKSKKHFSLWALGWESITHRDGKPLDIAEPRNNKRWLEWRPTSVPIAGSDCPGAQAEENEGTEDFQTDCREFTRPITGSDEPISVPMLTDRLPVSRPMVGNTSRNLVGRDDLERDGASRKILKALELQSQLTDSEIARICCEPVEVVAEVRRSLARAVSRETHA